MEGALLLLLGNQLLLVPLVGAKRVLRVTMVLQAFVFLIIEPLGICFVLQHRHLMLLIPMESLMDLVNSLHVSTAHGKALYFFLSFFLVKGDPFFILNSGDELVDLPVFVNNFLHGLEFTLFPFFKKVVLLWFLSSYGVNIEALTLEFVVFH